MLLRGVFTGGPAVRFGGITYAFSSVCKPNCHAKPILGELWDVDETDNSKKWRFSDH